MKRVALLGCVVVGACVLAGCETPDKSQRVDRLPARDGHSASVLMTGETAGGSENTKVSGYIDTSVQKRF